MDLVLSIFPGIDLLGRGFEQEGFCIVRGPDLIYGGDIKTFIPPENKFDGVIGGSPCQDFSKARRSSPTGYGLEMLDQFIRVVEQAQPNWFLLENVPTVPDINIPGYSIQRFDLNALECGLNQSRLRHFQFGSKNGFIISPERSKKRKYNIQPVCLASEGKTKDRRDWGDFCELQGLPRNYQLPGMSTAAKYKAVGNGVPVPMGKTIAKAIKNMGIKKSDIKLCGCGCGRVLTGRQKAATPACRKRLERKRKRD